MPTRILGQEYCGIKIALSPNMIHLLKKHSGWFNPARHAGVFIAVVLLFLACQVSAQIGIALGLDRTSYLIHEPIYAKIYIRNYSGRTLIFGEKEKVLKGDLAFVIFGPDGKTIKRYNDKIKPLNRTVLNPGASTSVIAPVSRMYRINKAGNYTIKAIVSHPQLVKPYESKVGGFSVFNGITVWKRIVGVPDVLNLDPKVKIKTRQVKILSFYDGKKKMFALSIEDSRFIYGVRRLADDIGNKPPQCEIDGLSLIHILVQISPKVFTYYVFNLKCQLEEMENYAQLDGVNPRLVRDPEQGTVMVVGGRKAVKGRDFEEDDYNPMFINDSKQKPPQ